MATHGPEEGPGCGGGGGGRRRRRARRLPGRQAPPDVRQVSELSKLLLHLPRGRSSSWLLTLVFTSVLLPIFSSSMQEAIGAQYMQRHLPKLEPFLRRVVNTSPRSYLHAIELPAVSSGRILLFIRVRKSGAGGGA